MKIEDANNIYVGSSQASALYSGDLKIWPASSIAMDYSTVISGGWGNNIYNNDNVTLTGQYWFGLFNDGVSNITDYYNWNISGSIVQTDIDRYDNSDPTSRVAFYKFNITGPATITLTSKSDSSVVIFTVTFN